MGEDKGFYDPSKSDLRVEDCRGKTYPGQGMREGVCRIEGPDEVPSAKRTRKTTKSAESGFGASELSQLGEESVMKGRNSKKQSSLALRVIFQENLISDQLKKFWDLEVSGLIDSKNESDVSEIQIMKNFESNIKHDEKSKPYKVGLPWKQNLRSHWIFGTFFTLRMKHLMQKVWLLGVEWDESLPGDIISLWGDFCEEVPQLNDFSIPRCYFSDPLVNNFKTFELHLFSDACTKAYGTVAYLRVTSSNKEILTSFVASKNRIAPLKTLTLPRLELMGALLSARLRSNILKSLKLDIFLASFGQTRK
ncbi:integrase catalytic domain-containing protein [Trichonephila clavipes]|nr:integrase catalytic domain-containing protein [Trichonephila clavipes]